MKGYIVYATYRTVNNKSIVHLYGRLENKESFLVKTPFVPYFFIKLSDLEKAQEIAATEHENTELKDFKENQLTKIIALKPSDVPTLRNKYEQEDIRTYEADIRFVQRFYMDNDILGTIKIEGEHKKGDKIDRIYENPNISPCEPFDVKLKTLAIDIETDKWGEQVYSYSIVGNGTSEVHIINERDVAGATVYHDEESLLRSFANRITDLDPDIITGWNVIDFDMQVLHKRFKNFNIPFILGRENDECRIRIQHDFFRDSGVMCVGRIVFDGISLVKQAFLSYKDFKLDTVADEVLGEKKIELEPDFWQRFPEIVKKEPERVVEYNLKDSQLVMKILDKLKLIELMIKKSLITGMQLDRVKGSVASLDSLYLRKAKKSGYICNNSRFGERTERIKGAYVMDPKPGIYDWVGVLDFKSLYPSIMRTYNIDPIAFAKGGPIAAPNGATFADEMGILPQIIEMLWQERDKAKRQNDDSKSYAIKIIMNSFYGVIANPSCRFYSLDMGNAITSYAREAIKKTASLIEEKGYDVLYGDTDSVFVDMKTDSIEASEKIGKKISKSINDYFDKLVMDKYKRKSFLELEFEKVFKVLMLPKMRGGTTGAKKRYAGLLMKDGKEEMKVTGMEIVRRDWTELAKELQKEMLDRVFHKKEVAEYVKQVVEDTKKGLNDKKLVYRKSIRKELDAYVKTTPPHVKAARMLPKLSSNIIEYYITVNGPMPVELVKKTKLDYDHYLEKQIKPIADTILSLFDQSFDELISGQDQKSLFDY